MDYIIKIIIIVGAIIAFIIGAIVIYILSQPVPEWQDLHGEEYLKWLKGEKGESDNVD